MRYVPVTRAYTACQWQLISFQDVKSWLTILQIFTHHIRHQKKLSHFFVCIFNVFFFMKLRILFHSDIILNNLNCGSVYFISSTLFWSHIYLEKSSLCILLLSFLLMGTILYSIDKICHLREISFIATLWSKDFLMLTILSKQFLGRHNKS